VRGLSLAVPRGRSHVKALAVCVAVLVIGLTACGEPHPLSADPQREVKRLLKQADELPDPSADDAYRLMRRGCKAAVEEYGIRKVARAVDAGSRKPMDVARGAARYALSIEQTDGWEAFRPDGVAGCLAGVRRALER